MAPVSEDYVLKHWKHSTDPVTLLKRKAKYVSLKINKQDRWVAGEAVSHQAMTDVLCCGKGGMSRAAAKRLLDTARSEGGIRKLPNTPEIVAATKTGYGIASLLPTGFLYLKSDYLDANHELSRAQMEHHQFEHDPRTADAKQYMQDINDSHDPLASARIRPDKSHTPAQANEMAAKLPRFQWERTEKLLERPQTGDKKKGTLKSFRLGHYLLLARQWGPGATVDYRMHRGQKCAQMTVARCWRRVRQASAATAARAACLPGETGKKRK